MLPSSPVKSSFQQTSVFEGAENGSAKETKEIKKEVRNLGPLH